MVFAVKSENMTDAESTGQDDAGVERVPPLNLTTDEAGALWELVKVGIESEEIQYSDIQPDAEAVHTKVKNLVEDDD